MRRDHTKRYSDGRVSPISPTLPHYCLALGGGSAGRAGGTGPQAQASDRGSPQRRCAVVPGVPAAGCGRPPTISPTTSPVLPLHCPIGTCPSHHDPLCSAFYLTHFSPPSQSTSPLKAGTGSSFQPLCNPGLPHYGCAVDAGSVQHPPLLPARLRPNPGASQTRAFRRCCWPASAYRLREGNHF